MNNLFEDMFGEIIGAIVIGAMAIIFIYVLIVIGNVTGQSEIANQSIQAILIAIFGIGLPIGIIALIKWLFGFSHGSGY